ncbi:MAG: hypothetical protein RL272_685 [Candidatus Parcubacteria bacterium]|jgi:hypothetical protein
MQERLTDERRRSLECDRLFSAGLCMSAAAILATRIAPAVPFAASLFAPRGASQAVAPIIWLAATLSALTAMRIAAVENRRGVAAVTVAVGAALLAAGVPFAHQMLMSFIGGATPAWSAGAVAFLTFGINAGFAVQDTAPAAGHARLSAIVTIWALFTAAIDGSGVFSGILAVLGILFFAYYRLPAKG